MKKNSFFRILLLVSALLCGVASAQQKEDIGLRAFYTNGSVLLRWYPRDLKTYQSCAEDGFVIERRQQGDVEGWQEIGIIRKGSYEDITSIEWLEKNAEMLKLVLYKDRMIAELAKENPDSVKVYQKAYKDMQGESSAYFYGMFLLANEFSVPMSKYAALNFMDESVQTQQNYIYRVRPLNHKLKYTSQELNVGTFHKTELPPMSNVSISRHYGTAKFKWYLSPQMKSDYSGYNLERSEDGIHFKKVNDRPIIHIQVSDKDKDTITYRDEMPKCGKVYYYRITGISGFGFTGTPSNVVKEMFPCDFMVKPRLESVNFNKDGAAELKWHVENPNNQKITAFEVQRAIRRYVDKPDTFTSVSRKLPNKTFNYTDNKPQKRNFYRIAAYGEQGQVSYSNVIYKYPSDTIPPSKPTGLKGIMDSTGLAVLTWNPNPEEGILGYRVFMANDSSMPFVVCNDNMLPTPSFSYQTSLNTLNSDVYFKVEAVGANFGHSPLSDFVKVVKPDTIPPAKIAFRDLKQIEDSSMLITWYDSPSDDVAMVKLYRNIRPDTTWVLAQEWKGKSTPQSFSDTMKFSGEMVAYKLTVIDESGNSSTNQHVHIQTKLSRPHCLKNLKITPQNSRGGILLEWETCDCKINYVRVYRKDDGSKVKLLKTLDPNEKSYFDKKVYLGHEYEYVIHPITIEQMSQTEIAKIKY